MLFRPARPSDLDEIAALLATEGRRPAMVRALWSADASFSPDQIRTAWTGGRIVACAAAYPRVLRLDNGYLPTMVVADVKTHAATARRGLASTLLAEVLQSSSHEGAVLTATIVPTHQTTSIFARMGWRPITETVLHLPPDVLDGLEDSPATAPDPATQAALPDFIEETRPVFAGASAKVVVRTLEERDLDPLLSLHEAANWARSGSVLYDAEELRGRLATLHLDGDLVRVAEVEGVLAGFIAAQMRGRQMDVTQLLLSPRRQDVWAPLLKDLHRAAHETAIIRLGLPADYRALVRERLDWQARVREREDLLLRAIDLGPLLRVAAPVLETRLSRSIGSAEVRVRIGPTRGGAVLGVIGARVVVESPRRDEPVAAVLPEELFLALLLGTEGAQAALEALDLPPDVQELLTALFPPRNWIFWRADAPG